VKAGGTITQSGALSVAQVASFEAGAANDITLTNVLNDFASAKVVSGKDVKLTDVNALDLGASTVSGDLTVKTTGAITQSGALSVNGAGKVASFEAGAANDITLDNAANDFASAKVVSGKDVKLTDVNALDLGASTVSGDLTVKAGGAITQSGALSVAQVASFEAGAANNITLTNAANDFATAKVVSGKDVKLTDVNDLILASINGSGDVSLKAGGAITDGNGGLPGTVSGNTLKLTAGTTIGTTAARLNTAVDTIEFDAGGAVFITEDNAVSVAGRTTAGDGAINVVTTNGTLTIGAIGAQIGIDANGSGTVLLQAQGAGKDVVLNQIVKSGTGHISVIANRDVTQAAAGDITTGGAGTIDVQAQNGSITMADGSLTTAGGNVRYLAANNVTLGGINAANVRVEATSGNIVDGGDSHIDVESTTVQLLAGGSVGAANAIDTKVTTIAVQAGGDVGINEADDIVVGLVGTNIVNRVGMDSSTTPIFSPDLDDVKSAGGDVTMVVGGQLDLQGNNDASAGDIDLKFNSIKTGGKLIGKNLEMDSINAIGAGAALDLQISDSVNVTGAGGYGYLTGHELARNKYTYSGPLSWQLFYNGTPLDPRSQGAQQKSAFDLVKFNPTLLSAQSVFGQPLFLHDNLDVAEPIALGLVDYLLAGAAVIGADPEFPPEANAEISSGAAGSRTSIGFYKPGGWRRLLQRSSSSTNSVSQ
jgi:hypothetical protein